MLKEEVKWGGDRKSSSVDTTLKLTDLGISKDQSSRWQTIADLPEKELEKHIVQVKASNEELTTVGLIRLARSFQQKENKVGSPPLLGLTD